MGTFPVIQFDYDFSPYGQKTRLALLATSTSFQTCLQSPVLPRPDLQNLGITFRRIPVLAVGKDVFCDSALIIDTILQHGTKKIASQSPVHGYEKGLQVYADTIFQSILPLIPTSVLTEGFVKDREAIFPILARPDFTSLRPSALGEFRATLTAIEKDMLDNQGTFLQGKKELGLDDIQFAWTIRWPLQQLGVEQEPGFGAKDFPRLHKWLNALPPLNEKMERKEINGEQAAKTILGSDYTISDLSVPADEPLGIKKGELVSIESQDSTPGANPQKGKLIGTAVNRVSLELDNGIHLHFPRIGYVVRKA